MLNLNYEHKNRISRNNRRMANSIRRVVHKAWLPPHNEDRMCSDARPEASATCEEEYHRRHPGNQ